MKKIHSILLITIAILIIAGCQEQKDMTDDTGNDLTSTDETFIIESEKVDCVGVGPQKCLVVNGEYFYDSIDGFEYQSGYDYELKVKKELAFENNIPADASKYRYVLVEVISKDAAIPKDCISWFDGCNDCMVEDGKLAGCTRKYCEVTEEPYCKEYESKIPSGCKTWFDGCNNCMVGENDLLACTMKYCEVMEKPGCLEYKIPANCTSWFDGCNTCTVSDGEANACTEMYCLPGSVKEPKCLAYK